jgi:alanyl-tRNA synthetase
MTSNDVRQSFLDFFKSKTHRIVPSAPVVPQNDPTLLFTNAGMNQFKDIFLGSRKKEHPRIADSQKCIRVSGKHNDLEEVGRDTYHHTFFEMLGNWSFGDYFKAEAIRWAWELLTDEWQLPKDRLYATVFAGDKKDNIEPDDEAMEEWQKQTDIDASHILRFGKKDNFWEMGDTGPCGPCSEIHLDRGAEYCDCEDKKSCGINSGCARYIELWNLVFIQFNRDEAGTLHLLPEKHVDTGAGFERLVAVLQKKSSNYDTDLFTPLLEDIARLTGKEYGTDETGVAFRVISDHIRALSFAIADGAIPGNEGRGYVLRRILRRAARFGRVLDMHEPFIYRLVETLANGMGEAYPELWQRQDYISRVIHAEEESFGRTLDRGIEIFESKAEKVFNRSGKTFPGKDAFLLHDTYGFPLDLTQLMAQERGLSVDVAGFDREMENQRARSSVAKDATYDTISIDRTVEKASEFVGYYLDETDSEVAYYESGKVVLNLTPFYAEAGGQVGDTGFIQNNDFMFTVDDTKKVGEHVVHFGRIVSGREPQVGDRVTARIDTGKRRATERNHTVTHLLHRALKTVLGEHVHQAGSLVHPEHMRFDFTHFEKVTAEEMARVEEIVNEKILENRKVSWQILPLDEAKSRGAMALFGEKYDSTVRMVEVDDYSRELCGGTHVRATGEIGQFVIVAEAAVAAGIRRVETLTGMAAHNYLRSRDQMLSQAAEMIGTNPNEFKEKLGKLIDEKKVLEKEIKKLRQHSSGNVIEELVARAREIDGFKVVAEQVETNSVDDLKTFGDVLRDKLKSGVGVLGAVINDKANFICIVTKDLVDHKNLKAGDIVKEVALYANGGGGGAPHMALAGGKDVDKIALALSKVSEIIEKKL